MNDKEENQNEELYMEEEIEKEETKEELIEHLEIIEWINEESYNKISKNTN